MTGTKESKIIYNMLMILPLGEIMFGYTHADDVGNPPFWGFFKASPGFEPLIAQSKDRFYRHGAVGAVFCVSAYLQRFVGSQ
jgi:hypothetical protein